MQYPAELLPKHNYRGEINVERLIDIHPNAYLLRKSAVGADLANLKFRDVFPGRGDLFGLSTYVFGDYKKTHFKFKTKSRSYWKEGDSCLMSHQIIFELEPPNIYPLYLPLKHCHSVDFPIKKILENKKTETVNSTISVVHRPMVDNYWHFELVVKSSSGEELMGKQVKEYHKRSAQEFAEDYIMQLVTAQDQAESELNTVLYVKRKPRKSTTTILRKCTRIILLSIKRLFLRL